MTYLSRPSVKLYCIHKVVMQNMCVNVQYGVWFAERGAQHWHVELYLCLPMCLCLCETHVFEFSTSSASYVSRTNQLRYSSANLRADWLTVISLRSAVVYIPHRRIAIYLCFVIYISVCTVHFIYSHVRKLQVLHSIRVDFTLNTDKKKVTIIQL